MGCVIFEFMLPVRTQDPWWDSPEEGIEGLGSADLTELRRVIGCISPLALQPLKAEQHQALSSAEEGNIRKKADKGCLLEHALPWGHRHGHGPS